MYLWQGARVVASSRACSPAAGTCQATTSSSPLAPRPSCFLRRSAPSARAPSPPISRLRTQSRLGQRPPGRHPGRREGGRRRRGHLPLPGVWWPKLYSPAGLPRQQTRRARTRSSKFVSTAHIVCALLTDLRCSTRQGVFPPLSLRCSHPPFLLSYVLAHMAGVLIPSVVPRGRVPLQVPRPVHAHPPV